MDKMSVIVATLFAGSQNPDRKPTATTAWAIYWAATEYDRWSFWQQLRAEGDPDGTDWFGRYTGWDNAGYPRPVAPTLTDLFGLDYAPDNVSNMGLEPGFGLHSDYTPPAWPRFVAASDTVTQQTGATQTVTS